LGRWTPPVSTLALIEEFLERRMVLDYERGHALCRGLAKMLAQRLDYKGPRELVERYPMAFVARVYATFHPVEIDEDWREMEPPTDPSLEGSNPRRSGLRRPPVGAGGST
jgi:hypothetical protein